MLRSFSQLCLPARGILIRMLQGLDGARSPPKYVHMSILHAQNLANLVPIDLSKLVQGDQLY
jgi:hypothetical protein